MVTSCVLLFPFQILYDAPPLVLSIIFVPNARDDVICAYKVMMVAFINVAEDDVEVGILHRFIFLTVGEYSCDECFNVIDFQVFCFLISHFF